MDCAGLEAASNENTIGATKGTRSMGAPRGTATLGRNESSRSCADASPRCTGAWEDPFQDRAVAGARRKGRQTSRVQASTLPGSRAFGGLRQAPDRVERAATEA